MSAADGLRCLRDHLWAAADVARGATRVPAPVLCDLLAAGRRRGFCESPDSLYSVGFVRLGSGVAYRLHLPAGPAFYSVVTLSADGTQRSLELVAPAGGAGLGARELALAEGAGAPWGLDTARLGGLAQVMVRQYFDRTAGPRPGAPHLIPVRVPERGPLRRWADGALAGGRFLAWRLRPVAAIRLIRAWPHRRFPVNRFLTMEDVLDLWPGGCRMVRRLGVETFRYAVCVFALEPGEALEIRFRPRGSRYHAFSVNNDWMQGIGTGRDASYRSSFQAPPGSDGEVTLRVSAQGGHRSGDLATGGRRSGLIHFREILGRPGAELPACRPVARYLPKTSPPGPALGGPRETVTNGG
jgi:hypothetical protein